MQALEDDEQVKAEGARAVSGVTSMGIMQDLGDGEKAQALENAGQVQDLEDGKQVQALEDGKQIQEHDNREQVQDLEMASRCMTLWTAICCEPF